MSSGGGFYATITIPLEHSYRNPRPAQKIYAVLEGYNDDDFYSGTGAFEETTFRATWLSDTGEHLEELSADDLNEQLRIPTLLEPEGPGMSAMGVLTVEQWIIRELSKSSNYEPYEPDDGID
jgi:hypothetical protein